MLLWQDIVNAICDDDDIKAISFVGSNTVSMPLVSKAHRWLFMCSLFSAFIINWEYSLPANYLGFCC